MRPLAHSTVLLLSVSLLGCSGTAERDGRGLDELIPDAGPAHRVPDGGGEQDVVTDSDPLDDADVLVPNDADRSDQGGQCVADEQCAAELDVGPCERPACENGHCVKLPLPSGTACDDSNACTVGDACKEGHCYGGEFDPNAAGCVQDAEPGSLWFTEIMGNPVAVAGSVDPIEGQWFEIGAKQPVRLDGLKLVYFEWDGPTMPANPSSPTVYSLAGGLTDQGRYSVFLRSQDMKKNGWGLTKWSYSEIRFSKIRNARLMLVMPGWGGGFPIPESLIVAKVDIAAGTFSDVNAGRSWQRSASAEDGLVDADWCHTQAVGEYAYDAAGKNYGTLGRANVDCN